jgi:hypothetical protein
MFSIPDGNNIVRKIDYSFTGCQIGLLLTTMEVKRLDHKGQTKQSEITALGLLSSESKFITWEWYNNMQSSSVSYHDTSEKLIRTNSK